MRLRTRWTIAFVVGELLGFVPPALTGAALAASGATQGMMVAGLVVAGALEGAVLGAAQARVLVQALPGLDGRRWILATSLGAAVAWLAGMGGSALVQALGARALWLVAPSLVVGLLAMGFLQWRVMRHLVSRSWTWVPVTAGAWLVGVIIPIAALSSVPNGWPLPAHAVVGVLAAVAMGATVGALTGRTLTRLVEQPRITVLTAT